MNIKQVQENLKIEDVVHHFGFHPSSIGSNAIWYHIDSNDRKPSLQVHPIKNIWRNWQTGEGGNIVHFVCWQKQCDISEALRYLEDNFVKGTIIDHNPLTRESASPSQKTTIQERGYTINQVKPLGNKALINYLEQRGINSALARGYCKEVYWTSSHGKRIFAIAFENNAGGYEVRNTFYKGNLLHKDISIIDNGSDTLKIFEGFIDFLSYISSPNIDDTAFNYVVLNSVVMANRLEKGNVLYDFIAQHNKIEAYLDNDTAGRECLRNIQSKFPDIIDQSANYEAYKDYNEYHMKIKF